MIISMEWFGEPSTWAAPGQSGVFRAAQPGTAGEGLKPGLRFFHLVSPTVVAF